MPCSSPRSAGRTEAFWTSREASFAFLDRETTLRTSSGPSETAIGIRAAGESSVRSATGRGHDDGRCGLAAFDLLGDENVPRGVPPCARLVSWREQSAAAAGRSPTAAPAATAWRPRGVNRNQGAESTLAYLCMELHKWDVQRAMATASRGRHGISVAIGKMTLQDAMHREASLFQRHPRNPILTARDWPYPAHTVFNAGACQCGNETLLLVRVEDRRGHSHLTVARSSDGVTNWRIDATPSFAADPAHYPEEAWGVEDPRVTWIDDRREWIVAYTAYSHSGPLVSLAATRDFVSFSRLGPVMPPEDKDAALFPRRFGGRYAMIHRPVSAGSSGAHIWLSFSPDLIHWGGHRVLMHARRGAWWDANKIGLGSPPLETPEGWLILYHGVRTTPGGCLYRLGLALLDLEDPSSRAPPQRPVGLCPRNALRAFGRRQRRRLSLRLDPGPLNGPYSPVVRRRRLLSGPGHRRARRRAGLSPYVSGPREDRSVPKWPNRMKRNCRNDES